MNITIGIILICLYICFSIVVLPKVIKEYSKSFLRKKAMETIGNLPAGIKEMPKQREQYLRNIVFKIGKQAAKEESTSFDVIEELLKEIDITREEQLLLAFKLGEIRNNPIMQLIWAKLAQEEDK